MGLGHMTLAATGRKLWTWVTTHEPYLSLATASLAFQEGYRRGRPVRTFDRRYLQRQIEYQLYANHGGYVTLTLSKDAARDLLADLRKAAPNDHTLLEGVQCGSRTVAPNGDG